MTSRGELLMALFFLCAFWSYAGGIPSLRRRSRSRRGEFRGGWRYALRVYVLPWACMFLSTFSKEQGATTLIGCVVYDFFENAGSVREWTEALFQPKEKEKEKKQKQNGEYDRKDDEKEDESVSAADTATEVAAERRTEAENGTETTPPAALSSRCSEAEGGEETTRAEEELRRRSAAAARGLLRRAVVLAVQTLLVCAVRVKLNGATSPDFNYDQNPAAFSDDRFTRIFSVCWVWCLYLYDAAHPKYLSCDWSGRSIPLIERWDDDRIAWVVGLWVVLASCVVTAIFPLPSSRSSRTIATGTTTTTTTTAVVQSSRSFGNGPVESSRRIALTAVFGFLVSPFLMSCNLLVRVGLMKGDRVMYLPLLGLCVLEALAFKILFCGLSDDRTDEGKTGEAGDAAAVVSVVVASSASAVRRPPRRGRVYSLLGRMSSVPLLLLSRLAFFFHATRDRNLAWTTNLRLWKSAYRVNPRSKHTMYNCGYQLALAAKYKAAERVLRPIRHPVTGDSPSTTFVYALALQNLGRCDEAAPLIDEALEVVRRDSRDESKGRERLHTRGRERYDQARRAESNLLAAKGLCSQDDVARMGKLLYDAVQVDPNNEYAVSMANNLVQMLGRHGVDLGQPRPSQQMGGQQQQQQMKQRAAMQQQRQMQAKAQPKRQERSGFGGMGSQ
uniref:DUF1736 domain-containing protein n=1 Tax=Odontella aurita TaxID=265563 RepID=A0A7S4MUF6_9STRA